MANHREFVQKEINENDVMIFSKSKCPFCKMAKKAFNEINQKFKAIELDEMDEATAEAIQDILAEMTNARTVPRVFVHQKFIGGGTDVVKKQKSGELQKLFEK